MEKLARDNNNQRLKLIHYHTFRHAKALREYDKTRSILHVKKVLGHKSIMTTQRYVELYTEIYGDLKPEHYVCEIEGKQLFRKAKETLRMVKET